MTLITRIARIEHGSGDERPLLIIDLPAVTGLAVAAVMMSAPFLATPLGRLSSPFALLVVLPPLALALEVFGWRDWLARHLARAGGPLARLLTAYTVWLVTSALLTLDVAAVAAASVGIRVGGGGEGEQRWQLGGAILGANVGSILLPFSNLTNLLLVAATGIGFSAYVAFAAGPAFASALAVGLLLALRARRDSRARTAAAEATLGSSAAGRSVKVGVTARAAGLVVVLGAFAAVVVGLAGSDVAVPFALCSGILVGLAVASGRLDLGAIVRAVPLAGLSVIAVADVAGGPIAMAAELLPRPDPSLGGLVLALAVGGTLAAVANNLPAAVFGASWLVGAHPATVVAYVLGTNVVALATPHGSVATILARAVGHRHAVSTPPSRYLRAAWAYAAVGAVAGLAALVVAGR
jgi:arsenical pump membrane protein